MIIYKLSRWKNSPESHQCVDGSWSPGCRWNIQVGHKNGPVRELGNTEPQRETNGERATQKGGGRLAERESVMPRTSRKEKIGRSICFLKSYLLSCPPRPPHILPKKGLEQMKAPGASSISLDLSSFIWLFLLWWSIPRAMMRSEVCFWVEVGTAGLWLVQL